ncbi:ABC transporter substrate-binding protein [Frondihabitans sucicola]|uniref:ABC transporter substrate-binding protein n=1 Tax=Frondihabitans sucicola TaxID=1268041 RepID=A0ABM8GR97_9MICO|nr:extracellular solute-binding protein [Frondihabitans sucicola]BDZ50978.1 ABC transporter substrate-binding protein [Frondihabitans sucicola]
MPTTKPSLFSAEYDRRQVFRFAGAGGLALASASLLAACTGTSGGGGGSSSSKTTTVGSNYSDPGVKSAFGAVTKAFDKSSGDTLKVNTVSHNDFQNNINNYLQGSPDAVFTWFSGFRMKSYAKSGLTLPLDDVWSKIGSNFSDSIAKASTADDGKKYLVPWVTYPWAVFYSKSLFADKGYEVPVKWDDFKSLAAQMKKDGLIPIAFADKDLWPACGTFDYLNMRINGYQFHVDLMAHKESWNQAKVKDVFDHWNEILPFHQTGALGRIWQDAANAIGTKKAGMMVVGSDQIGVQLTGAQYDDLDFFAFPEINPDYGQTAVEAPIDGFMMSKKGANDKVATAFLEYLGTAKAQQTYLGVNKADIATAKNADTSNYTALQKKAQSFIGDAKDLSQFLDRDSLPAFASDVMEPALQSFISSGTFDMASVESQAKQKYASN